MNSSQAKRSSCARRVGADPTPIANHDLERILLRSREAAPPPVPTQARVPSLRGYRAGSQATTRCHRLGRRAIAPETGYAPGCERGAREDRAPSRAATVVLRGTTEGSHGSRLW